MLAVAAAFSPLALAAGAWRSGNPPTVASAQIDSQRRLVVTYSAPDGVTYGGHLYLDNDPMDAQPVASDPQYGPIMYCNNKFSCLGRWSLAATPGSGPFTFTTEPLDAQRFPAGTYYVQVDTTNEDPYPSTRQEEFSNIGTVVVPAKAGGETTTTGGAKGGGGTASADEAVVTLSSSATLWQNDGKKKPISAGSVTLADGERLISGSRALALAIKEGRVVLAPHTQIGFEVADDGTRQWYTSGAPNQNEAGEAWFEGKRYKLVVAGGAGSVIRTLGVATFVVRSQVAVSHPFTDEVEVLKGKVEVSRDAFKARPDPKRLVLTAGFETFVTTKAYTRPPTPPKKFTPPAQPFWS